MRLNRIEYPLMKNPIRAAIQRHVEAPRLCRMGGPMRGGQALELGCGWGVGTQLILELFGADAVDAFELGPRMAARARRRHAPRGSRVRVWVGDAPAISSPDASYNAVSDFGIIHHVPDWRRVLAEGHRVLKPGGRLYASSIWLRQEKPGRGGWIRQSDRNFSLEPMRRHLAPPGKGRVASRKRVLRSARVTVAAKRRQRARRSWDWASK